MTNGVVGSQFFSRHYDKLWLRVRGWVGWGSRPSKMALFIWRILWKLPKGPSIKYVTRYGGGVVSVGVGLVGVWEGRYEIVTQICNAFSSTVVRYGNAFQLHFCCFIRRINRHMFFLVLISWLLCNRWAAAKKNFKKRAVFLRFSAFQNIWFFEIFVKVFFWILVWLTSVPALREMKLSIFQCLFSNLQGGN